MDQQIARNLTATEFSMVEISENLKIKNWVPAFVEPEKVKDRFVVPDVWPGTVYFHIRQ